MNFKEFLNEASNDWDIIEPWNDAIVKYGAGNSLIAIVYDKDSKEWKGYGKNNSGDVDARGFSGAKTIDKAALEATKAFKLKMSSLASQYLCAAAKELSMTGKCTADLSGKFIYGDTDNYDKMREYIDKNK